jgi:hypothetical protein
MKALSAFLIFVSLFLSFEASAQKVAWPSEYTSNHYLGMWNVMQVGWELPRVNENWATWARVDCPVHIYEISERDYTPMPDCFMLIYRARTFEQIRIIPKPVSRYKNENRA